MKLFGLIGYPLQHSYSKEYFTDKFKSENISNCQYLNFEIKSPNEIHKLIEKHPGLIGLNVTIPYKESIISLLDELDPLAEKIAVVNCIKVSGHQKQLHLKGYNTDAPAFKQTLKPLLKKHHKKALILGTGGSSKAIADTFDTLGIEYVFVSRQPRDCNQIRYAILHKELIRDHQIIINTSPVGMFPDIETYPEIPYQFLTNNHLLYDLVYNPEVTVFLKKGLAVGAEIKNGLEMLHLQAELSWKIWNEIV